METRAIEHGMWIAAPLERAWQAVIEPKQLEQRYAPPLGSPLMENLQADLVGRSLPY